MKKFLNINRNLYSIDIDDCSSVASDKRWKFIKCRDDNFEYIKSLIPKKLDIIFIDNNTISKIHHNCKPCFTDECERFEGSGDLVLELPGGTCKKYDIKKDDEVELI